MFILTRKHLREEVHTAVAGAVVIGLAFYFRSKIEFYLGDTLTDWLLPIIAALYVMSLVRVISGWLSIRDWERREREMKDEQAQWEREEQQTRAAYQAEYDVFNNWVKRNPVTAEDLMCTVEDEQIEDAGHRAWIRERRQTEGPDPLTDLPRLFEWLKAQRDLKKIGIDPPAARRSTA
jgi:hypothetical protein